MYRHSVLFAIRNPFHKVGDFFSHLIRVTVTDNTYTYISKDHDETLVPRWKIQVDLGRSAGYVWGRTFFIARGLLYPTAATYPGDNDKWWEHIAFGKPGRSYIAPRKWQMGYTGNANKVPYVDGT